MGNDQTRRERHAQHYHKSCAAAFHALVKGLCHASLACSWQSISTTYCCDVQIWAVICPSWRSVASGDVFRQSKKVTCAFGARGSSQGCFTQHHGSEKQWVFSCILTSSRQNDPACWPSGMSPSEWAFRAPSDASMHTPIASACLIDSGSYPACCK